MLPDYFYTACIPDGLQLYMKVSDCLDRYSSQTVHRIRTLSWERILFVERHIKYTKKIKLNAKRNIVKFNSIQFI